MKRICLWGTSLAKVGDAALLYAASKAVWSRIPGAKITLFARHGEVIERRYPEIEAIKTVRLDKVFGRLMGADLLVFVGGPFMENALQAISCFILFAMAKLLGVPAVTYGSTFIEYNTGWGKFFYRHLLEAMDAVTVREDVGLRILQNLGVRKEVGLFADPRFLVDRISKEELHRILADEGLQNGRPLIGISTRYMHDKLPEWIKRSHGYTEERSRNAYAAIGRAVESLAGEADCVLVPMHPAYKSDEATAQKIRESMSDPSRLKILKRSYGPMELFSIFDVCEMFLASRLVSAVFATATATPMVSIAYEPRMISHMKGIGCSPYVIDWKDTDPVRFAALAEEVWQNRESIAQKLAVQVEGFRKSAQENTGVMERYCKHRSRA